MLAGARAHSAWRAAAVSEMEVSAYFISVHMPSFGRAVIGNSSDSEIEGSAYFTSVHIYTCILSFGRAQALLQTAKWKYLFISQVCLYRFLDGP